MESNFEELLERAREICKDLDFPFDAAFLEFIYALEDIRIESLRPNSENIHQWMGSANGIALFATHLENKTGRAWNSEKILKLWKIYQMEGKAAQRMVNRDSILVGAIMKSGRLICHHCGRSVAQVDAEVDHIIPVALGGESTKSNLRVLCGKCNRRKGDRYWLLL